MKLHSNALVCMNRSYIWRLVISLLCEREETQDVVALSLVACGPAVLNSHCFYKRVILHLHLQITLKNNAEFERIQEKSQMH